jgi:hypothetical protein
MATSKPTNVDKFTWAGLGKLFPANPISLADGEWNEDLHPRDDAGKFTDGTGNVSAAPTEKELKHHEKLEREAAAGVEAVGKLLDKAVEAADFESVGPADWSELDESLRTQIRERWEQDQYENDAFDQYGFEAEREYVQENMPKIEDDDTFDAVREKFIETARERGLDLDPDSVVRDPDADDDAGEIDLSALRYSDGSPVPNTVGGPYFPELDPQSETPPEKRPTEKTPQERADRIWVTTKEDFFEKAEQDLFESDGASEARSNAQMEAISEAWHNLSDSDRLEYGQSEGLIMGGGQLEARAPETWTWQNGDDDHVDYARTRAVGRKLVELRTEEIIRERGLADPVFDHTSLAGDVWESWKGSSTSGLGLALQLATSRELGAVDRLSDQQKASALWSAREYGYSGGASILAPTPQTDEDRATLGMKRLQAYVRAQWETSQYILKQSGDDHIRVYRAVMLPAVTVRTARREKVTDTDPWEPIGEFTKLPDLQLKRNGVASTTTKRSVANEWNGVGDKPYDARRVVLRFDAPRTAALSLPVFGQNIHSEEEVVLTGLQSGMKWDAWLDRAPEFNKQQIAASMRAGNEIDLFKIDEDTNKHWLSGWRKYRERPNRRRLAKAIADRMLAEPETITTDEMPAPSVDLSGRRFIAVARYDATAKHLVLRRGFLLSDWNEDLHPRDEDGKFTVGMTSSRPDRSDNKIIFSDMREFESNLKKIPTISDVTVKPGVGAWQGVMSPTWIVSYKGNGQAKKLIAETGKRYNQDAVLMMREAKPDKAGSPMGEFTFAGAVGPQLRERVGGLLAEHGVGGWTWFKSNGRVMLRAASVPQWGGQAEAHLESMRSVQKGLQDLGIQYDYATRAMHVEVLERDGERSYDTVINQ